MVKARRDRKIRERQERLDAEEAARVEVVLGIGHRTHIAACMWCMSHCRTTLSSLRSLIGKRRRSGWSSSST